MQLHCIQQNTYDDTYTHIKIPKTKTKRASNKKFKIQIYDQITSLNYKDQSSSLPNKY